MSFKAGASNEDTSSTSSSTTNGTQTYTPNAQYLDTLYGNVARAQGIANTPFQPYTGQQVASFTPTQLQAQGALTGIAADQVGAAPLQSAIGVAQGVSGYSPSTVTAQPLTSVDLSGYMNPYTSDVINTAMNDLGRQQQIADQGAASQATAAGAFGGSRSAVLQNLTDDSYARAMASTAASLNQANYGQAQSAAQSDLARALAAGQSNQSAGLQGAGLNLNAAGALAGMGNQQLSQAQQWASDLGTVGDAQQQNQQAQLNAAYQQWQLAQQYPIQMQQLLNSSLQLLPNYGTTATSQTQTGSSTGSKSSDTGSSNFGLSDLTKIFGAPT
jgi:hypothetical protein